MFAKFNGKKLVVCFTHYTSNKNVAIQLFSEQGEPWATATTNPDYNLENRVAIKDWGENKGMARAMIEAGIVEPKHVGCWNSGYVSAPIFNLTPAALAEIK